MKKPIIFVTRLLPEAALDRLAQVFEVHVHEGETPVSRGRLLEEAREADALLTLLTDTIDAELLDVGTRLKVVSNYAVGYNNIDVEHASRKGIVVCNTPGVLTEATADLTWALLMACARRIVESDRFVRDGHFKGWEPMLLMGHDVFGKTLGIVGMGRIGEAVARRAAGFNMRVIYHDPGLGSKGMGISYESMSLDELLAEADFVTLHTPLTKETLGLIGERELALMKHSAILINTARGPIVNEQALIRALQAKRIAAAGFDVYAEEPAVPNDLLALDNVVLLPHIGSATVGTRTRMGLLAAENAIAVLEGRPAPARVN